MTSVRAPKRLAKTLPRLCFRLLLTTTTPNVAFVHHLLLHVQTTPEVVHVLEFVLALQERPEIRLKIIKTYRRSLSNAARGRPYRSSSKEFPSFLKVPSMNG